jgi:type VI secretion system secreted protein VgrG
MTQALHSQAGAVMKVDSIDRWRTEPRWSTNAIELRSLDYRAVNDRPVSALDAGDAPVLTSRDTPGAYAYSSREQGQRFSERHEEALAAARQQHVAAGNVRTVSPGTTFTLHGHAPAEETGHIALVSRFDIARRGIYPRHSLTAQCNESDCLHRMI